MGPLGVQEMVVIFLVALVLFGPKKLPELGKTIAKAVTEFRRAQSDLKATFDREMQSIERENESLKEATRTAAAEMSAFGDIDLMGGADGTYGAGTIQSPQTPTVSASEAPGAESPTEAATGHEVASVVDHLPAAAEPEVNYGQMDTSALDAAIDQMVAEAVKTDASVVPAGTEAAKHS